MVVQDTNTCYDGIVTKAINAVKIQAVNGEKIL